MVADIIAPTAIITAAMAIIKNKVAITAQLEGRRLSWRPFPLLHSGEAEANDGIKFAPAGSSWRYPTIAFVSECTRWHPFNAC